MPDKIDEIKELIQNHLDKVPDDVGAPDYYSEIRDNSIKQEVYDEWNHLNDLFTGTKDEDEIKEAFKTLCRERDERNHDTSLSYFAMPEGLCNANVTTREGACTA